MLTQYLPRIPPIIPIGVMLFIINVTSLSAVRVTDTISKCAGSDYEINPLNISNGEEFYLFDIFARKFNESRMKCIATWIKGKEMYHDNERARFTRDRDNQLQFKIENLQPSDAGIYRVEVVLTGSNAYIAERFELLINDTTVIPTSESTTTNKEIVKTSTEPNNHTFAESITENTRTRTGHNNNPVDDTCNKTNLIIPLSIVSILLVAILTYLLVKYVRSKQYQRVPITQTV